MDVIVIDFPYIRAI